MKQIYDYVSFNPDSLYFLKLIIFLEFGGSDKDGVGFYTSDEYYKFFIQTVNSSLKFRDVR